MELALNKQENWKRQVVEARADPDGIGAYCRARGLNISTFNYWSKKFGLSPPSKPRPQSPFARVTVEREIKYETLPDPEWLASFVANFIRRLK